MGVQAQSAVLMFLAKRRVRHRRAAMAATAIQRLWRGAVGRAKADRWGRQAGR